MADHMRRHAGRIDARPGSHVVQDAPKALPRQMTGGAGGGKQPARAFVGNRPAQRAGPVGPIADPQPFRKRRPGRSGQRDHAFLAALAPDQQHGRIAPAGRDRQRDQFTDAHSGGIEQLDQAIVHVFYNIGRYMEHSSILSNLEKALEADRHNQQLLFLYARLLLDMGEEEAEVQAVVDELRRLFPRSRQTVEAYFARASQGKLRFEDGVY